MAASTVGGHVMFIRDGGWASLEASRGCQPSTGAGESQRHASRPRDGAVTRAALRTSHADRALPTMRPCFYLPRRRSVQDGGGGGRLERTRTRRATDVPQGPRHPAPSPGGGGGESCGRVCGRMALAGESWTNHGPCIIRCDATRWAHRQSQGGRWPGAGQRRAWRLPLMLQQAPPGGGGGGGVK